MESSNNSNELKPCQNCMTFYGTQNTNFLCSKCFKEQQDEEKQNAAATASPEVQQLVQEVADAVSPAPTMQLPSQGQQPNEAEEEVKEPAQPVQSTEPVAEANVEMKDEEEKVEEPKVQTNTNKCWECNRKVGLVQTACKCGYVYCPKHRHSEAHNCTFDYHQQAKNLLEKNNPQILHKKMEKMF